MDAIKHPLSSVTVWAGIIGALAAVAGLFNIVISPEDQTTLAVIGAGLVSGIANLVAIWGRIRANARLR